MFRDAEVSHKLKLAVVLISSLHKKEPNHVLSRSYISVSASKSDLKLEVDSLSAKTNYINKHRPQFVRTLMCFCCASFSRRHLCCSRSDRWLCLSTDFNLGELAALQPLQLPVSASCVPTRTAALVYCIISAVMFNQRVATLHQRRGWAGSCSLKAPNWLFPPRCLLVILAFQVYFRTRAGTTAESRRGANWVTAAL